MSAVRWDQGVPGERRRCRYPKHGATAPCLLVSPLRRATLECAWAVFLTDNGVESLVSTETAVLL